MFATVLTTITTIWRPGLKVVTTKSIVKAQLNKHMFHNATVTTSCKFKEIKRKSCVVIQLCLSILCCDSVMSFKEQHKINYNSVSCHQLI